MPLDTTYQQLMRVLSARALEWLRQQIVDLPDPLPADHPALPALAQAARIAPVLSGFRGHMSPLEDIAARRLSAAIVNGAAQRVLTGKPDPLTTDIVMAGGLVAMNEPLWHLACERLAADGSLTLADHIALSVPDRVPPEAEALLSSPIPDEAVTPARIDDFAMLLMQVYRHGAIRPRFSHARIFGAAFANAMRFADWARRKRQVTAMAQMGFCLRLIDPDHDIGDLTAEVIGSQRPDGSFPVQGGFSTRDQDLSTGTQSTLMVLLMLHMAAFHRWRRPVVQPCSGRPLSASRDRFAAAVAPMVADWARAAPRCQAIDLAAAMTRATGQNWFHTCGLERVAPDTGQLQRLADRMFGDAHGARHARASLNLVRHWPDGCEHDPAMRWLRRAPVTLAPCWPEGLQAEWIDAAASKDRDGFDRCCRQAARCRPGLAGADLRAAAGHYACLALAAADHPGTLGAAEAADHLHRLCLIASLFEGDSALSAAA